MGDVIVVDLITVVFVSLVELAELIVIDLVEILLDFLDEIVELAELFDLRNSFVFEVFVAFCCLSTPVISHPSTSHTVLTVKNWSDLTCYNCGLKGHIRRVCPSELVTCPNCMKD